jgi:PAS domain S-box-containing protein
MISRLTSFWTNLPLRGKGLVVVAIPFIALLISGVSFAVVEQEQRDANQWVAHSLLVRNTAGRVLRYQTDAAASVRGYLLTGDVDYLAPAQQAQQDLPKTLATLETLVHDNPQQFNRAQHLGELSQQNLAYLAQLQKIAAGTSSDPPASVIQQLDNDQTALNGLRDTVSTMQATEDQLLAQRTARVDDIRSLGEALILINLAIGLIGGIVAMILFTTGIVRRVQRLDEQTARLEAGESLLPISPGKDELGHFEQGLVATARLLHDHQTALKTTNQQLQDELVERKRAEEMVARLSRRNELILNAAGDGIVGTDRDGRTIFVNPAAARMLGYSPQEFASSPSPLLSDPVTAALEGVVRHVADEEFTRRDGTRFPVEYASAPIREDGEIVGAVVTFKDITERQAIDRLKAEFVSTVSHELRTPLTSIRGSLGLLSGGVLGPIHPSAEQMLKIAVTNTDRLIRLINDILDIERLESGRANLTRRVCDLPELLALTLEGVRGVAEQARVTLAVSSTDERIEADPDRIIQTLTNLLGNAIKFSQPGSTVWLEVIRAGDELLFSVRDEGRGIPRDKLVSIFERFSQVDASDSREKGGTGLGLAICRTIIQQHGGRIWAESAGEGHGSTFFFTLPALPVSDARVHDAVTIAVPAAPDQSDALVLVCDDDPSTRQVLSSLLERRGYRVLEAASGAEAIEQAAAQRPAAILLDLLIPEMDGWETMAALKARPETCDIPVVVCSVVPVPDAKDDLTGIAGWANKPLDTDALFRALSQALDRFAPEKPETRDFRILIVEDDDDLGQVLTATFRRRGIATWWAQSGREAIALGERVQPDLFILDLVLPDVDGFAVVDWLHGHDRLRATPLVVYTAKDLDRRDMDRLWPAEVLTKGRITPDQVEARIVGLLDRMLRTGTDTDKEVSEDVSQAHPTHR